MDEAGPSSSTVPLSGEPPRMVEAEGLTVASVEGLIVTAKVFFRPARAAVMLPFVKLAAPVDSVPIWKEAVVAPAATVMDAGMRVSFVLDVVRV